MTYIDGPFDRSAQSKVTSLTIDAPFAFRIRAPERKIQSIQNEDPIYGSGVLGLGMKIVLRKVCVEAETRILIAVLLDQAFQNLQRRKNNDREPLIS